MSGFATILFDFDALFKEAARPQGVTDADWGRIWTQFKTNFSFDSSSGGSLITSYSLQYSLQPEAAYLASIGQHTAGKGDDFALALIQTIGILPKTYISGAVDLRVGSESFGLSLSRAYDGSLLHRSDAGVFGMGWSSNYDIDALTNANGDVSISGPGLSLSFKRGADGTYSASAPSGWSLESVSGVYVLTYVDGSHLNFTAAGKFASSVDPNGNTVSATWSASGQMTAVQSSAGDALTFTYTAQGRIATATDSAGRVTSYTYDASGNHLISVTDAEGTTTYGYNNNSGPGNNALTSVTNPDGTHRYFGYSTDGRLATEYGDGGAGRLTYDHSQAGKVIVSDALGQKTTYFYDSLGQIVRVQDAAGQIINLTHDGDGNLTKLATAGGSTSTYTYDAHGVVISYTDPLNGSVSLGYDGKGNLTSLTDQSGNTMTYSRDANGNLTAIGYQDGTRTSFDYGSTGLVETSTNAQNQTQAYAYDAAGRLIKTTFSDGTTETYSYDAHGNLISASARDGGTTIYAYDAEDHLTSVTDAMGRTQSYAYDEGGRRIERVDPDGTITRYSYDVAGHLQDIKDGSENVLVSYSYDLAGHLTGVSNGNGTSTSYTYDVIGNVTGIKNLGAGGAVISQETYTYTTDSQVATKATLDGAWSYTYDSAGQLIRAVFTSTNAAISDQDLAYTYDAVGNRASTSVNGVVTEYQTNGLNQYTSATGTTYTYDADGNLTGKVDASGTWTYSYDVEGQLTDVTGPGGETWSYQYDALGYRIATTHNGVTETYVVDPTGIGTVAQTYDATGNVFATYTYGHGLAATGAGGSTSYYISDLTGNITGLTDMAGTLSDSYFYDPFGDTQHITGISNNPFLFNGLYGISIDETNLSYMRARYYSEEEGRFVARDPSGVQGGLNLYEFVNNDPIGHVDPFGLIGIVHTRVSLQYFSRTIENYGNSIGLGFSAFVDGISVIDKTGVLAPFLDPENAKNIYDAVGALRNQSQHGTINQNAARQLQQIMDEIDGGGSPPIDPIKNHFNQAAQTRSPLILDLDGDGVETIGHNWNVHFDHDGNGFAELTGWAAPDDGLLVLDRNRNGRIDDGGELFGSRTALGNGLAANGFLALRALDGNGDGVIDSSDEAFSQLRIWKDANSNGVTDAGELLTLSQAGVLSLSTGYSEGTEEDAHGNQHLQVGQYSIANGQTRGMTDVWFDVDTARTIDKNIQIVPDEIASLPDVLGAGNIPDLHQAMVRDASGQLRALVEEYAVATDANDRSQLLFDIIYRWAGVQDVPPDSRAATQIYGNVIGDARKLATLEAFLGEDYVGIWCWGELDRNPHGAAAPVLLQAFNILANYVAARLDAQTRFAEFYNLIEFRWDHPTASLQADVSALVPVLSQRYAADPAAAIVDITQFAAGLNYGGNLGQLALAALRAAGDPESLGFAGLLATLGLNSSVGDFGDNSITGDDANNVLFGLAGKDQLVGLAGDDSLIGGEGDDYLAGGDGADTYVFDRGDGKDTINNDDGDEVGTNPDTLKFGDGIAPEDVEITRDYFDLVLKIKGTGDEVRIYGFLDRGGTTSYAIDIVSFTNGTVWTAADIMAWLNRPTAGDDYIFGSPAGDDIGALDGNDNVEGGGGSDTLDGAAGNDWLYGGDGDDVLTGGADRDYLYGEAGNDTLSGGSGDDYLDGGNGSDTYRFSLGDGQDTISNYAYSGDETAGKVDALVFGEDILPSSVTVRREGGDLVLTLVDGSDRVTVSGHFYGPDYRLDEVRFADGTVWDYDDIQALVTRGSVGDDYMVGSDAGEILDGLAGNDTIYGSGGNDTLSGGLGDDYLDGGSGSDTYRFGLGDGQDTISNYAYSGDETAGKVDALAFGEGILPADVIVRRSGGDLILALGDSSDRVTVSSYFYGSDYRLDEIRFADGTVWGYEDIQALVKQGSAGDDYLVGGGEDDALSGLAGIDIIYGGDGDDTLSGGADNDYLSGEAGDDTLSGGLGDDYLDGGSGSDTYRFGLGDGQDTISNYAYSGYEAAGKVDALVFGAGILPSSVTVRRSGGDLVLTLGDGSDRVTVSSHFYGPDYRLDEIRFADGTIWSYDDIQALVKQGSAGDDYLVGSDAGDVLDGLAGNDMIYGGDGSDTLSGAADNDYLYGQAGDDALTGGSGDDYLDGGLGSDTYRFALGDGQDTISNYAYSGDETAGKVDALVFGESILPSSVTVRRSANDLVLTLGDGSDRVTVSGHFYGPDYRLDEIRFADGTVWNHDHIQTLVLQPTNGNDYLVGSDAAETLNGLAGDDTIYGADGDDLLNGGEDGDFLYGGGSKDTLRGDAGNDWLYGEAGDDELVGGSGDDYLDGGSGSDTYRFSIGDGQDTIYNYVYPDSETADKVDALVFGEDILPSGVVAWRSFDDLVLTLGDGSDRVTVSGYFYGPDYRLDEIRFADGTVWDHDHIQTLVLQQPVLEAPIADQIAEEGAGWSMIIPEETFSTESGQALSWQATLSDGTPLPDWLNFDATARAFSGTPPSTFSGTLEIKVTARLGDLSASDIFELVVTAVNEAPTAILLSNLTIAENSAAGTVVGALSSVDPDPDDTVTYSLTDDAGGTFAIADGKIVVAEGAVLDFETNASYAIGVKVTDAGGLTHEAIFTIGVTDVNEVPTDIGVLPNLMSVAENSAAGTVVATLSSIDPDAGDTAAYSLTDDADGTFAIIDGKLVVAAGATLDFETTSSHSVSIKVTDAGGLNLEKTFLIGVSDVNETPTDIALSGLTVTENAAAGTEIGMLSAVDMDAGDTASFSLTDDADGTFEIVDGKLVVAEGSRIDFETRTSYTITIRATDEGGLAYDKDFVIDVGDVPEPITGGPKNDKLFGGSSDDILLGLRGNDVLDGGAGADTLDGGKGNDTASYASAGSAVTVNLARPAKNTGDAAGDNYISVENLLGSKFADNLTGNGKANIIDGGKGNDLLTGGGGSDIFIFGAKYDKDTITDFVAKGKNHDVIDLSDAVGITSFKDLKNNHIRDIGNDLQITAADGSRLILLDTELRELAKADFHF